MKNAAKRPPKKKSLFPGRLPHTSYNAGAADARHLLKREYESMPAAVIIPTGKDGEFQQEYLLRDDVIAKVDAQAKNARKRGGGLALGPKVKATTMARKTRKKRK